MRLLGRPGCSRLTSRHATLKDATSGSHPRLGDHVESTHYILARWPGPHPYPMLECAIFHAVIGHENQSGSCAEAFGRRALDVLLGLRSWRLSNAIVAVSIRS